MAKKTPLRPAAGGDLKACGGQRRSERNRKEVGVKLPLELGSKAMCQWCDKKLHPVEIIASRKLSDEYEYYVHYTECKSSIPNPSFRS